ncbi:endolytic transglycosylase MltG [Patescibacteria group bacterium]|nr:endolytic transglycosylase MltG [Patescibacteria group bacterium]
MHTYLSMLTQFLHTLKEKIKRYLAIVCIGCTIIVLCFFSYLSTVPRLTQAKRITIPEGTSLIATGTILKQAGLIRSSLFFRLIGEVRSVSVKAGTYSFVDERRMSEIIERLDTADYGDVYVSVTFPEGITTADMARILEEKELPNFDRFEFETLVKESEGYLFPDTYLLLPDANTQDIVAMLLENFQNRTQKMRTQLSDDMWSDIIIMASIIEKETSNDPEEQKIVSGILWKRIHQGIPLQVDAPFVYALGKGSANLTTGDLRTDGPYNTYTRTGLPPTPIGNPGLSAIEAAVHPIDSLYFFYLHDTNGVIHYGVTHDDHVRNKQRYL